jgi:LDH2 family malate/lactate/ureidoglycolate dehydrogenase
MVLTEAAVLEAFAADVLAAAAMAPADARTVATCLVEANLRGVDSHGVLRLIQYVDTIRRGEVLPAPSVAVVDRQPGRVLVDAGGGYGYVPTLLACDLAVEMARERGAGLGAVRNSHHFGMAAIYAARIARAPMIGVVFTNTSPIMAPPGVTRPIVGNNPIAVSIPRRADPPILLDMALSQTAFGRVRLAAAEGREIPLGWALDREGKPTTDARRALEAELLSPVGAYKGLGLAIVIDVLAGVLTGSPFGQAATGHANPAGGSGHWAIALVPSLFVDESRFFADVEQLVDELKAAGSDDQPVLLPGEPEARVAAARRRDGVPLSDELSGQLAALAAELGVTVPQALSARSR